MEGTSVKKQEWRQPIHGKDEQLGAWQVATIYTRARGFGEYAWCLEMRSKSKRPGQSADDVRAEYAAGSGRKLEDIRVELW